jgi:ubiquinone/menaquinone biosynthesis C-methylase UbiE
MSTQPMPAARVADHQPEPPEPTVWALGDYDRFARALVWGFGPELVSACDIGPGRRVLDVAAGTGNVALRAAQAGASVVACDLTPEHFDAGRRGARELGVEVEWVEADAQALPFADGAFDVVTSSVGAIFAPDHQAVADEMLRVCRPGGTIGMINFAPDGLAEEFFGLFAPYAPPPAEGALPPTMWGAEAHVRELFGDRVASLSMTRGSYVERSPGDARAYRELFKDAFGPVIALYESLAGQPERRAALDRDFLDFATRANRAAPGAPAEYVYDYVRLVARRRS